MGSSECKGWQELISNFEFRISNFRPPTEPAALRVHTVSGAGAAAVAEDRGSDSGRRKWQWAAATPGHSNQRHRGWKNLQVVQNHPPEVEPPRHQGTKMFTKRILGVFPSVLVPLWLRRFALTPRKATVFGHRSTRRWTPRPRRLLAVPVAVAVAVL